ncbi:MAG: hypothetical protein GY906_14350 [bacterium]|nr:hypothetical protein [bacterium]
MKNIVILIVVVVVALLAFNFLTTGELRLLPEGKSAELREVLNLQKDLATARQQYGQAARAAGVSGLDTTSDASAVLNDVQRIEGRLRALKARLTDEKAVQAAADLEREIKEFREAIR